MSELIQQIMSDAGLASAAEAVRRNKGAAGVDDMDVSFAEFHVGVHAHDLREAVAGMTCRPQAIRRARIPKPSGRQRPLGLPTAVDRVIQLAVANAPDPILDPGFSGHSHGFRHGRSARDAVEQALEHLNEGCCRVVDLDIGKFFDRVSHDRLVSIPRTKVNDRPTPRLIRQHLKAGVMEDGAVHPNELGVPQGGPLSSLPANICLDLFDKELEQRGLRFRRHADDVVVFARGQKAAERAMTSVAEWLRRSLRLTAGPTRTKVARPSKSTFPGFQFWNQKGTWKARPAKGRARRLCDSVRKALERNHAAARPLAATFTKVSQIVRGWISCFRTGSMKGAMDEFGQWLRHKVRVIILRQWKRPRTIFKNLATLSRIQQAGFDDELIRQTASSRLGLCRSAGLRTVSFLISPKVPATSNGQRPGLIDPLECCNSVGK